MKDAPKSTIIDLGAALKAEDARLAERDARRRLGEWLAAVPGRTWRCSGSEGAYLVILDTVHAESFSGDGQTIAKAISGALWEAAGDGKR